MRALPLSIAYVRKTGVERIKESAPYCFHSTYSYSSNFVPLRQHFSTPYPPSNSSRKNRSDEGHGR